MNSTTSTFDLVKKQSIASLNIEYQEYQHQRTRARHIHLASDNKENVFMVALRTVPTDSTGVAHILEHTSLCGSAKYPVRDPFFMMTRRSLNTFMNAFTSSDWTAYPFASQNKKDFDNLLAVYLDAVFFARLDELDFAQEGHRLEFEEPSNASSALEYKGVVYNEMKGAMSAISSQLWQAVGESLFPDTTYGFNSGGDPKVIPDLSYQQLKAFYQTHYHPDNAVFVTFGDIEAREHQQKFEQLALQQFESQRTRIEVPLQQTFSAPISHSKHYPLDETEKTNESTHQIMAWVLGDIRDPLELMTAHLLSSILLENSASPLQHALETSDLGKSPSPLCGLDDSGLQMVFVCGLEGCNSNSATDFEQLILNTLQQIADKGIARERLVALLDQLELQQREISGDSYPYGLQIMLSCLATALHRGDPAAALNIDPILKSLREKIEEPTFVPALVKRCLLDNPHRVTLTMLPDTGLAQKTIDEETRKLAAIKAQLDAAQQQVIIDTAQALQQRQAQSDDPEILPKVSLQDVPPEIEIPGSEQSVLAGHRFSFYPQGTNGLTYRQIVSPLPTLNEEQLGILSLHNRFLTEVGVGEQDYLQTQNWQTAVCGGINAFSSIRGHYDNEQQIDGYFTLSSKGLVSRSGEIDELLYNTYHQARFDEHQRISELVAQATARAEQSITGNGHGLAMAIACQGMSPAARLGHSTSGILGIKNLKTLNQSLQDTQAQLKLCEQLTELQQALISNGQQFLGVAESNQSSIIGASLGRLWEKENDKQSSSLQLPSFRQQTRELWICNSQVNFCAKAYPTVTAAHADAAALTVLGGVLRNGFLHTAIREQGGAYGSGANQDSGNASFRFFSYRDPRMTATLDDFDQSIRWLLDTQHKWRVIEEAILGVISSLDKPSSPAGTAKQHFHNLLHGRTPEQQMEFRNAVLAVTEQDLKRVAETYLQPENASIGVITHGGEQEQYNQLCADQNIAIHQLAD